MEAHRDTSQIIVCAYVLVPRECNSSRRIPVSIIVSASASLGIEIWVWNSDPFIMCFFLLKCILLRLFTFFYSALDQTLLKESAPYTDWASLGHLRYLLQSHGNHAHEAESKHQACCVDTFSCVTNVTLDMCKLAKGCCVGRS